jgi:cbb3-type cytochrome oxidase subunit 3
MYNNNNGRADLTIAMAVLLLGLTAWVLNTGLGFVLTL